MATVVIVHSFPAVVNVCRSMRAARQCVRADVRSAASGVALAARGPVCASQPLGLPLLAALVDRLLLRRGLGRRLLRLLVHHCGAGGGREAEEIWIKNQVTNQLST